MKFRPMPSSNRDGEHGVECNCPLGLAGKADRPFAAFADRVGGRSGKNRNCEQPSADNAEGEDQSPRTTPASGLKASAACAEVSILVLPFACSVAAVVMIIAMAMMFENAMPDERVDADARELLARLRWLDLERLLVRVDPLLFRLL